MVVFITPGLNVYPVKCGDFLKSKAYFSLRRGARFLEVEFRRTACPACAVCPAAAGFYLVKSNK